METSQHDPGPADDIGEGKRILPGEWKTKGEMENSQQDLGPAEWKIEEEMVNSQHNPCLADDGGKGKRILPDDWKTEGEMGNSQQDPGPAEDGWEGKPVLPDEWKTEEELGNSILPDGGKSRDKSIIDKQDADLPVKRGKDVCGTDDVHTEGTKPNTEKTKQTTIPHICKT